MEKPVSNIRWSSDDEDTNAQNLAVRERYMKKSEETVGELSNSTRKDNIRIMGFSPKKFIQRNNGVKHPKLRDWTEYKNTLC